MGGTNEKETQRENDTTESLHVAIIDSIGIFKDTCRLVLNRQTDSSDLQERIERRLHYNGFLDDRYRLVGHNTPLLVTARNRMYTSPWVWSLHRMLEMCSDALTNRNRIMTNVIRHPGNEALAETDLASNFVLITSHILRASAADKSIDVTHHSQTALSMIQTWVSSFKNVQTVSESGLITVQTVISDLLLPYMKQGASYTVDAIRKLEKRELRQLEERTRKARKPARHNKLRMLRRKKKKEHETQPSNPNSMASDRGFIQLPKRRMNRSVSMNYVRNGSTPTSRQRRIRLTSSYGTFQEDDTSITQSAGS